MKQSVAEEVKRLERRELVRSKYSEQVLARNRYIEHVRACERVIGRLEKSIRYNAFELALLDMPPRRKGKTAYVEWARSLYYTCDDDTFRRALKYANAPDLKVVIGKPYGECLLYKPREEFEWVITPVSDSKFWLKICTTKKEAIAFCKALGWKVVEQRS